MSENQVIPEAAVEAAARAVFLTGYPEGCGVAWDPWHPSAQGVMRDIRTALEAAAPHIAERAYNAGHLDGMNDSPNNNPYRPAK